MKTVRVELFVTVPVVTPESEVEQAINAALDEPPCDWQDWYVSGVSIVKVYEGTGQGQVG